jgi:N-methylhydantoinase A
MKYALGIDIGGTFTDIVAYDEAAGIAYNHKELTTPDDPARGVIAGIRHLFARDGLAFAGVHRVVHATTLFTNALIERAGAPTGLITTAGFRDVLEIGHERKYELYDIFIQMPRPLVPRRLRLEVPERLAPDGRIEIPLDTEALLAQAESLIAQGVQSIAITFLHAYTNPLHERLARDLLAQHFPELFVSISSDVAPEIREFERTSTTVANAYIKPLADRYLRRLGAQIRDLGIEAELFLMLSNGGLTNVAEAGRRPIEMLESGPAAGALSGAFFGLRSKLPAVLAFDMGGTTAKLSVVDNGKPVIAYSFEAAREKRFANGSGLPITISTIELIEIGAGGGSIARLDPLGLLKVGPESAGSAPGPACYQRGGTLPTVTDANLLLGYLDPDFFAGGTMRISRAVADAALQPLADAAGLTITRIAWGMHNLVNESMASAARVHIAEHGRDPRRYALLTTGGGGPMHGCEVARKLGITTIVCPPSAGVASAIGLLVAPARIDRVATVAQPLDAIDWPTLEASFQALERDGLRVIAETGINPEAAELSRLADIRYAGQGFELVVSLSAGPYSSASDQNIRARFEDAYRAIFARTPPETIIEIINIRVSATAPAGHSDLQIFAAAQERPDAARKGSRPVYFGAVGDFVQTPVFDRKRLSAGVVISGPAVIEEAESTLLVPPDGRAEIMPDGNILTILGG